MWSLRARLTALASLIIALVLGGGGTALYLAQSSQLRDNVDRSLQERADAVEDLLDVGELPAVFTSDDEDRALQVVADDGRVVIASANIDGEEPIAPSPSGPTDSYRTDDDFPVGGDAFRILTRAVDGGAFVLHVAESTDDLEDSSEALLTALAIAVPATTLVFALLTWWLVGGSLRPVDEMRAEVDSISDTRGLRQLPQPARSDEIGRLARTLNLMLERLHKSGERQRQFVADAAHELRTPLTRIRTTVEVDLAQPDDAVPTRTNAEIRREAIGLQRLIDDLLLLASSDDGRSTLRGRPVDLDDVVRTEVREHPAERPVRIDASGVLACDVVGDEGQLRRVVQNLLSNAVRHASTSVEVSLRQSDGLVELVVDDDGPGIPADQRESVFGRFTRLDEARTRDAGGAGLGLAIALDIVTRHDGSITVTDSPLGGARVIVALPDGHDAS